MEPSFVVSRLKERQCIPLGFSHRSVQTFLRIAIYGKVAVPRGREIRWLTTGDLGMPTTVNGNVGGIAWI